MNDGSGFAILGSVLGVVVLLNVISSLSVVRDFTLQRKSKGAWFVFIWLVPVVGSLFALRTIGGVAPEALPYVAHVWPLRWFTRASGKTSFAEAERDQMVDLTLVDNQLISGGHDHHAD